MCARFTRQKTIPYLSPSVKGKIHDFPAVFPFQRAKWPKSGFGVLLKNFPARGIDSGGSPCYANCTKTLSTVDTAVSGQGGEQSMEIVSGFPLWGMGLAGLALVALADIARR